MTSKCQPVPAIPLNVATLLQRAQRQLNAWAKKYGAHDPNWLPMAGDVRLLEDIDEALAAAPQSPLAQDVKDAQRYRTVRAMINATNDQQEAFDATMEEMFGEREGMPTNEEFDAVIDRAASIFGAAIAAQDAGKGEAK